MATECISLGKGYDYELVQQLQIITFLAVLDRIFFFFAWFYLAKEDKEVDRYREQEQEKLGPLNFWRAYNLSLIEHHALLKKDFE